MPLRAESYIHSFTVKNAQVGIYEITLGMSWQADTITKGHQLSYFINGKEKTVSLIAKHDSVTPYSFVLTYIHLGGDLDISTRLRNHSTQKNLSVESSCVAVECKRQFGEYSEHKMIVDVSNGSASLVGFSTGMEQFGAFTEPELDEHPVKYLVASNDGTFDKLDLKLEDKGNVGDNLIIDIEGYRFGAMAMRRDLKTGVYVANSSGITQYLKSRAGWPVRVRFYKG